MDERSWDVLYLEILLAKTKGKGKREKEKFLFWVKIEEKVRFVYNT